MRNLLFSLIMMISSTTCCLADGVRLDLHSHDDFVVVSIENTSSKDVKVSRLFTQKPAYGLIGVHLMVDGRRVFLNSSLNEEVPSKSDYFILKPFDVIGRSFYISDIKRIYGITARCFSMSVTYHDVFAKKFDSLSLTLKSNKIRICQ